MIRFLKGLHHLPSHPHLVDYSMMKTYCSSFVITTAIFSVQNFPIFTIIVFFCPTEITHRFQTAKPAIRQTLLKYLLPWLHNMELVDPSLPQSSPLSNFLVRFHDNYTETFKPPLKGEGWGSQEATKMVLNNLFYITVKVGPS